MHTTVKLLHVLKQCMNIDKNILMYILYISCCFAIMFFTFQGIDCFDYNKEKTIIATGGVDHVVRLWDPYVTFKPVAILKGHQACVIDVAIHEELSQVFSYSKDGVSLVYL